MYKGEKGSTFLTGGGFIGRVFRLPTAEFETGDERGKSEDLREVDGSFPAGWG